MSVSSYLRFFDSISVATCIKPRQSSVCSLPAPFTVFSRLLYLSRTVLTLARCVSRSRRRTDHPLFSHPTSLRLGQILLNLILSPLYPNPTHTPTMADAAHQWPENIHRSFKVCGGEESMFFGPLTRLMYTLFPLDGPYEFMPLFKNWYQDSSDLIPVLVVTVNRHPVFFIDIKPLASLLDGSKREEADEQMRRRFSDLSQELTIPTLHGVSAFGSRRLSFYEYDAATSNLQPEQVPRTHGSVPADVAPISRWDYDVLEPEGANRLKDVVKKVKEMSAPVAGYGQVCKVTIV
jgi:hypothetical protein